MQQANAYSQEKKIKVDRSMHQRWNIALFQRNMV